MCHRPMQRLGVWGPLPIRQRRHDDPALGVEADGPAFAGEDRLQGVKGGMKLAIELFQSLLPTDRPAAELAEVPT